MNGRVIDCIDFATQKGFLHSSSRSSSPMFILLVKKMRVYDLNLNLNIGICWSSVPGFFILERIFLNEFQSYHTSRLSGGILRMNLGVDKILSDSVASQFW